MRHLRISYRVQMGVSTIPFPNLFSHQLTIDCEMLIDPIHSITLVLQENFQEYKLLMWGLKYQWQNHEKTIVSD